MSMNKLTLGPIELHIDLSFSGFLITDLEKNIHMNEADYLNNDELWTKDLASWLSFIKGDFTLNCPPIVRQSSCFSIGLNFTNDLTLRGLNKKWRQKNEQTDVLSFPVCHEIMPALQDDCVELGDVVISVAMAQRQAREQNHSLQYELRWLVTHGLLHLLGWDHPDSQSLTKMLTFQEQLILISGNV